MATQEQGAVVDDRTTPPVDHEARAGELERELEKLRGQLAEQLAQQQADDQVKPPKHTHRVFLADGSSFTTHAPVMTKHHVDGVGLVPVTFVTELGEEE